MRQIKKLTNRQFRLITEEGIRYEGTYDPEKIFFHFEEELYEYETEVLWNFCDWLFKKNDNSLGIDANETFQRFLADQDGTSAYKIHNA